MGNGFDAVRSELGEFAGPDLVRAVDELALDQLHSLAETILNLPRSEALPERPVTEIWPLVSRVVNCFTVVGA